MRKGLFITVTSFILLVSLHGALWSDEKSPAPSSTGQISLPWEKFQKLLSLDEERISLDLDDFTAIVRQTGTRDLPPFAVNQGKVVLKKEDFKRLLKSMEPPRLDPALGDFMLISASYKAKIEKETTEVSATFNIEVLLRAPHFYQSVICRVSRGCSLLYGTLPESEEREEERKEGDGSPGIEAKDLTKGAASRP